MRSVPSPGVRLGGDRGALTAFALAFLLLLSLLGTGEASPDPARGRVVHADVVAMDHLIVYNRFGSFDPYGMIYALQRDVQSTDRHGSGPDPFPTAKDCHAKLGTEPGGGRLEAGKVVLKPCKRPRPLVLRGNVDDVLDLTFTNLLREQQPDISGTFCRVPQGDGAYPEMRDERSHADALCRETEKVGKAASEAASDWPLTRRLSLSMPGLEPLPVASRGFGSDKIDPACLGLDAVRTGEAFHCRFRLTAEGTHLFSNPASPAGGQGNGGSLAHGLFGVVIVEPAGSKVYRSQVSKKAFDAIWASSTAPDPESDPNDPIPTPHARTERIDFEAFRDKAEEDPSRVFGARSWNPCRFLRETPIDAPVPVANMHRRCGGAVDAVSGKPVFEIVHGDLNAVVVPPTETAGGALEGETARPFREFTVVFHDELKTFYTNNFKELGELGPLSGVRDGFGINYGASGVGSLLIANRKRIGPAGDCAECLYEEFFLESWANGDPALLETFPDDPSNVHHSYLNDRIVFRNLHAGPKETHVFHLHSHQWFAGNDWNRGSYLDSQTIGPQQGFSYWIYQGGLDRYRKDTGGGNAPLGYWASLGAGNRNRTPGDAIFHCHLYPHFAQGMWELWRVHDVLEDGSRTLPDGQKAATLSLTPETESDLGEKRTGTSLAFGPKLGGDKEPTYAEGTPIPGLLPVPGQPAPLLPTYGDNGIPGYPFYVAGMPGRRAPQAPLDIAEAQTAQPGGRPYLDGGLPRHVVEKGERKLGTGQADDPIPTTIAEAAAIGDMTVEFESLDLKLLPYDGTAEEKRGMAFHHDGGNSTTPLKVRTARGENVKYDAAPAGRTIGYPSNQIGVDGVVAPQKADSPFVVNGAPPKPGAPFADPCGAPGALRGAELPEAYKGARKTVWEGPDPFLPLAASRFTADPALVGFRRFEVSAVQLDMTVNGAGWHDPQARINVLSSNSHLWKNVGRQESRSRAAEPFFFRAFSGECIEFRHTNELPKDLALDDFQMKVPTDTIGQHIHLVKFDVTSSDGSGNGFNYEDGTFAPDEILDRICKSQGSTDDDAPPGVSVDLAGRQCGSEVWTEHLIPHRNWFQTTVQRWFADPILSPTGETKDGDGTTKPWAGPYADRTMRTVFTHDHFGPSNIQQHGFYSALLIEPPGKKACVYSSPQIPRRNTDADIPPRSDRERCVEAARNPDGSPGFVGPGVSGSDKGVGAMARVTERSAASTSTQPSGEGADGATDPEDDPYHPDYREFALAIADFALLYDGHADGADVLDLTSGRAGGIERLAGEAAGTLGTPSEDDEDGEIPPARHPDTDQEWVKARSPGLIAAAKAIRNKHGRPVYPPARPEAISQHHHDPYLVNYRVEPIPLRVGAASLNGPALPAAPCGVADPIQTYNHRDVRHQAAGRRGDLAEVFRSATHGDPCTPILDAISGERLVFRLIQGAQEVQHLFTIEGRPFRRNVDQKYPYGARWQNHATGPTRWRACMEAGRDGWPRYYNRWLYHPEFKDEPEYDPEYWQKFEALLANCDNIDGYLAAQEIGISEHFELSGPFSRYSGGSAESAVAALDDESKGAVPKTRLPRDSLFHFGTADALWNGAWGLVRVFPSTRAPDWTTCLAQRARLSGDEGMSLEGCEETLDKRLAPLEEVKAGTEIAPRERSEAPRAPRDLVCPEGSEQVFQAVAAVEARRVLRSPLNGAEGTPYVRKSDGNMLYDPDGLLFVPLLLSELRVVKNGVAVELTEADVLDRRTPQLSDDPTQARPSVDWPTLKAAMKRRLENTGAQPLVLRMNAGQCMHLVFVNALTETPDASTGRSGLLDRPGDATMPKIVPLNVDDERSQGGDGSARDLTPSARLALSVPVSTTSGADDAPNPVGLNPLPALPPMTTRDGALLPEARWQASWSTVTIYGGRVNAPEKVVEQLLGTMPGVVVDSEVDGATFELNLSKVEGGCDAGEYVYSVFGQPFCAQAFAGVSQQIDLTEQWTPEKNAGFAAKLEAGVHDALRDKIKAIPYAYGALPIKSIGDIVSHGTQGLAGTLIVEPKTAGLPLPPLSYAAALAIEMGAVGMPGRPDRPLLPAALVREHALLWQDGLNLWDRKAPTYGSYGLAGRPLPDCTVCNDSYDRGEVGVSYRSEPFFLRLRKTLPLGNRLGPRGFEPFYSERSDLNASLFPRDFLSNDYAIPTTPEILLPVGSEAWVRVTAAPGRARQRAFVVNGHGYQDIFPGFGSGHSSLIASGKAATAALQSPATPACTFWFDGPRQMFANGAWGSICATGR